MAIEKQGRVKEGCFCLEEVPPRFFVSVAFKAFRDSISGLKSTFAEFSAGVDFKEDTDVADSGALRGVRGLDARAKSGFETVGSSERDNHSKAQAMLP
ncbi:MAG TPA: hypothetical protein VIX91_06835 [Candidatus Acidoferrum sp.]